jgi:hypothetical protein
MLLMASVGVSVTQRFWVAVAQRYWKLGSVDALFGLLNNPLSAFNLEPLGNAQLSMALVAITWSVSQLTG